LCTRSSQYWFLGLIHFFFVERLQANYGFSSPVLRQRFSPSASVIFSDFEKGSSNPNSFLISGCILVSEMISKFSRPPQFCYKKPPAPSPPPPPKGLLGQAFMWMPGALPWPCPDVLLLSHLSGPVRRFDRMSHRVSTPGSLVPSRLFSPFCPHQLGSPRVFLFCFVFFFFFFFFLWSVFFFFFFFGFFFVLFGPPLAPMLCFLCVLFNHPPRPRSRTFLHRPPAPSTPARLFPFTALCYHEPWAF